MRRIPFAVCLSVVCLTSLCAQGTATEAARGAQGGPPKWQRFVPDDYQLMVELDLAAMREHGIWEEIERSAIGSMLVQAEDQLGVELAAIDRMIHVVRHTAVEGADPDAPARERFDESSYDVMVGNRRLAFSEVEQAWNKADVDDIEARTSDHDVSVLLVGNAKVRLDGADVMAAVAGARHAGRPCPDLLSMRGDGKRRLLFWGGNVHEGAAGEEMMAVFRDVEWPAGERPTYVAAHLEVTGDEDDPHLGLRFVVRHRKVGEGMDVTEQFIDAQLDKVGAMPQLAMLKPMLAKITKQRSGSDATWAVDLGRSRQAVGQLMMLAPMVLMTPGASAQRDTQPGGGR